MHLFLLFRREPTRTRRPVSSGLLFPPALLTEKKVFSRTLRSTRTTKTLSSDLCSLVFVSSFKEKKGKRRGNAVEDGFTKANDYDSE